MGVFSLFIPSAPPKMVEEVGQHSVCLALTHQTDVTFNFNLKNKKPQLIQRMECNNAIGLVVLLHKVVLRTEVKKIYDYPFQGQIPEKS